MKYDAAEVDAIADLVLEHNEAATRLGWTKEYIKDTVISCLGTLAERNCVAVSTMGFTVFCNDVKNGTAKIFMNAGLIRPSYELNRQMETIPAASQVSV